MSMPTDETPKLVGKCPDCGSAMTVRKSKRGKTYYSCLGYPDCKFMSWDIPTGERCPECNSALVKSGRTNVKCSNKDCSYKIVVKEQKGAKAPVMADNFTPPPLEEPVYFQDEEEYVGYFPPDYEDEV